MKDRAVKQVDVVRRSRRRSDTTGHADRLARRLQRVRWLLSMPGLLLDEIRIRIDEQLADSRAVGDEHGVPISCPASGAGCWGCCRGQILVSAEELCRLVPLVDEQAKARIRQQADELRADPEHAICPLLDPDTKACTVYAERPLTCRGYAVVSPAEDCYPEHRGTRQTSIVLDALHITTLVQEERPQRDLHAELLKLVEGP